MILPKHSSKNSSAANSRDAPFNQKSFGTGPYMVADFKPGDVVTLTVNPNYRDAGKPFFGQIEIKGGGDASRRRAPCSRPASTTTPGTCRSKRRS